MKNYIILGTNIKVSIIRFHGNQFLQISKNRYGEVNIKKASEHNLG